MYEIQENLNRCIICGAHSPDGINGQQFCFQIYNCYTTLLLQIIKKTSHHNTVFECASCTIWKSEAVSKIQTGQEANNHLFGTNQFTERL